MEFLKSDEVILHPDAVKGVTSHMTSHVIHRINVPISLTTDILEGNAKGIMRVILAMAERYLPHTVKARANNDSRPPPPASDRMPSQPMSRSSPPPDG